MRVLLVNAYTDHNKGSAALTIAVLRQIRAQFPDASVGLVPLQQGASDDPSDDFRHTLAAFPDVELLEPHFRHKGRRGGTEHVALATLSRAGRVKSTDQAVKAADLVVSRGGVIFHAREGDRRGLASMLVRTMPTRVAVRSRVPTVLYGAQFGPFPGIASRRSVGYLAKAHVLTMVRDQQSRATFERACGGTPRVMPDSVFALELDPRQQRQTAGRLAVAVSAHVAGDLHADADRFAQLAATACEAAGLDRVTFFLHVSASQSERAAAEATIARFRLRSDVPCEIDDRDLSPHQLQMEYRESGLVMASRLHAVILALAAGAPALSIPTGVTFKERAVLSEIGLGHLVVDDSRAVKEFAVELASSDGQMRRQIEDRVSEARRRIAVVGSELRSHALR